MLSKCANPGCKVPFLYLHEGKLFRFDTAVDPGAVQASDKTSRHVEFFWLCQQCAGSFTLHYEPGRGITTVALIETQARAASAR